MVVIVILRIMMKKNTKKTFKYYDFLENILLIIGISIWWKTGQNFRAMLKSKHLFGGEIVP